MDGFSHEIFSWQHESRLNNWMPYVKWQSLQQISNVFQKKTYTQFVQNLNSFEQNFNFEFGVNTSWNSLLDSLEFRLRPFFYRHFSIVLKIHVTSLLVYVLLIVELIPKCINVSVCVFHGSIPFISMYSTTNRLPYDFVFVQRNQ